MQKDNLIIYHGLCDDGFGAMLASYLHFKENAEYVPGFYNEEFFAQINYSNYKNIFLIDISFPLEIMQTLINNNDKVILIDHHESALKLVAPLKDNNKIQINLDMTRSAAMMAWQYFHPEKKIPLIIKLVEDVDLWRFTWKDSKFFNKALRSYERSVDFWMEFINDDEKTLSLINDGKIIDRYFNTQLKEVAGNSYEIEIDGIKGLVVNANHNFTSELGNYLAKKCNSFAITWRMDKDGIALSMRSVDGVNVAQMAEKFGGGGHPKASAFRLENVQKLTEFLTNHKVKNKYKNNLDF